MEKEEKEKKRKHIKDEEKEEGQEQEGITSFSLRRSKGKEHFIFVQFFFNC